MININRKNTKYLSLSDKLNVMEKLAAREKFDTWEIKFNAYEMKELRDFLTDYIEQYNKKILKRDFDLQKIREKMVPIQVYFRNEDCIESLDACENDSCLGSEPNCFSRKMKGQIEVLLDEIFSVTDGES